MSDERGSYSNLNSFNTKGNYYLGYNTKSKI